MIFFRRLLLLGERESGMKNMSSPQRRHLVFYHPSLAGGGIERQLILMAPLWIEAGYDVTFLLHTADGPLIGEVPANVKVVALNVKRTIAALLPLARFLRENRPDLLISSLGHNNIVALWAAGLSRTGTPVVLCQHNALSAETVEGRGLAFSSVIPALYRRFLPMAAGVVAVSHGVAEDIALHARVPLESVTVIHNPVVDDGFDARMDAACDHPWLVQLSVPVLVAVGRFVEQKDFPNLLEAFARVLKRRDARLILIGDGLLRPEIEAAIARLGIGPAVDLTGYRVNPLPFVRRAALFVMSSSHEGFGNVLVEALACGTPVVSTDCPFGPSEILEDGRYGKLVPVGDPEALARAILETLDAPLPAATLRARGRSFSVARAVAAYRALFEHVIDKRGRPKRL